MQERIQTDDFTIVLNGEDFYVSLMEALLISSKVSESVQADAGCRSIRLDSRVLTHDHFVEFWEFVYDVDILEAITLEAGLRFLECCRLLGNDSLALVILALIHPIRAVTHLPGSSPNSPRSISLLTADIDYCASLFYLYSAEEVRMLSRELLHRILESDGLCILSEDQFADLLIGLGEDFYEFAEHVEISNLSERGFSHFLDGIGFANFTRLLWERVQSRMRDGPRRAMAERRFFHGITSTILGIYPRVLDQFVNRVWKLVYRGSEHGFRGVDFHGKCDRQSNTVTLILTTTGCIFGGFTPVSWDSSNVYKPDPTNESFLFRIKDSRNNDALRFPILNPSFAIHCGPSYGPTFGNAHDLYVADCCNQNTNSYTNLGTAYTNDTGINGKEVFTGDYNFKVQEIEIFSMSE